MTPPSVEPQADGFFKIVHGAGYGAAVPLLRRIEAGNIAPADAEKQLKEALRTYPWQFEVAWTLSTLYTASGDFRQACEVRFEACQRLMKILPEEEDADPTPLNFEHRESQFPLLLLRGSAIDHFLFYEFEMAAALFETLLELDEEDHLGVTPTLAWCYVALDELDSFEEILPDLDDKSAEKALLSLWAELNFSHTLPAESVTEFRDRFPAVFQEFTADEHAVTEEYLAEIDSERLSPQTHARLLWLQTEHLWQRFPELIVTLKEFA